MDQSGPVPNAANNTIWGGIQCNSANAPVTSITATFTVPTLSGQAGSEGSIWVGIGNIFQTGIYSFYDTGHSGNNNTLTSWTWFIAGNGASQFWNTALYPSSAGDVMTLTLALSGNYWVSTQSNATQSWTYTNSTPVQAVGIATLGWQYPQNDAVVIIENENSNLPNYGTLTFSNISMTPAIDPANITYLTTVGAHTQQTPGTLSGGAFTMTWNNFS